MSDVAVSVIRMAMIQESIYGRTQIYDQLKFHKEFGNLNLVYNRSLLQLTDDQAWR